MTKSSSRPYSSAERVTVIKGLIAGRSIREIAWDLDRAKHSVESFIAHHDLKDEIEAQTQRKVISCEKCQFPVRDQARGHFRACDSVALPGKRYCGRHYRDRFHSGYRIIAPINPQQRVSS